MSLETPQNMSTSVRLHVIKRQQPSHICTKTPSWVSSAASFQALRLPLGPFPPTSKLGHWWLSLFWPSRDHEGVTSQTSCHTDTHQTTRLLIFGGGAKPHRWGEKLGQCHRHSLDCITFLISLPNHEQETRPHSSLTPRDFQA